MVVVMLISLYTVRVLMRVLGITDYGIYNVVSGFVTMFSFLNTSMAQGTQRFYNYEGAHGDTQRLKLVFNTSCLIQLCLALFLALILEIIGVWYMKNYMIIPSDRFTAAKWIFHMSVISMMLVVFRVPFSAAVISHEKMDMLAIVSIADALLKLAIVVALPYISTDKLIVYGALSLCISFFNLMVYYIFSKVKFEEIRFKRVYDKELFQKMLSFSGWNLLDTLASMVRGQGLNMLLNSFFGPVANAARGVAEQVGHTMRTLSVNVLSASRPQLISSYAESQYQRFKNLLYAVCKISFYLMISLAVPVALESNYIINLWLNGIVPEYTIPFTMLTILDMQISVMIMPLTQVFHAVGQLKRVQLLRSMIILAILPVSWIFLKQGFGPMAVFWITVIDSIMNLIVTVMLVPTVSNLKIRDYVKLVIKPCALFALLMPLIPILLHYVLEESFMRLLTVILSSVLMSLILMPVIFTRAERSIVFSLGVPFINKIKIIK
jgi:O-antigen/teichoic acid export membrane protein